MRRHALGSAFFLLLGACSSFSSTAPEPGTEDGGAGEGGVAAEGGTTDAAADTTTAEVDASPPADGGPDAGDPACTVFDSMPNAATGWALAIIGSTAVLAIVPQASRSALEAHVDANSQRAALEHNVSPGVSGSFTIETDFIAVASTGSMGSLVELLVLQCNNPALKIALEVDPSGMLAVESTPATGQLVLGAPTATWRTLKLVVTANSFIVELDGSAKPKQTMAATFANAVGCTVSVGARSLGNIAATTGYYSRACIR